MDTRGTFVPTAGGPRPTLEDAGGSLSNLGPLDMHWRSLNEPQPAAHPAPPAAAGEAAEAERQIRETVRLALEYDAPNVKLGSFNWPVYMRGLLGLLDAAQQQLAAAQVAAEAGRREVVTDALLWELSSEVVKRIRKAVNNHEVLAQRIDWRDVENDWWNWLDEKLRPTAPEAPEAAGPEGGEGV